MKPTSEHIKQMLLADVNVDTVKYPIFIGVEPASNVNCITLFDYGNVPQLNFNKEEKYETPSVQVRVRAANYIDGWELSEAIKESLHGRANEQWDDEFYTLIKCLNGPMAMGWDDNQRIHFVLNFDTQRYSCV